jgi:hypothetical protein
MKRRPQDFEVLGRRTLAQDEHSSIIELTLRTHAPVASGDMLFVDWLNHPDNISGRSVAGGGYWTTPIPHRPSTRHRADSQEILSSVLDLGGVDARGGTDIDPLTATHGLRITPRFFTVAGVRNQDVTLFVTQRSDWPKRASSYLAHAKPGDHVTARVLPHPHRITGGGSGLAVATGSGAAGVFAALRSGIGGISLIWGVGSKVLEPCVIEELADHQTAGHLDRLIVVHSPQRVTDHVPEHLASSEHQPDWIYVSGNSAMGEQVHSQLEVAFGVNRVRELHGQLRYINST